MTEPATVSPTGLLREILSSRSDRALSALEARTWQSWKLALDRSKVLPQRQDLAGAPSLQVFLQAGSGARVTDIDGGSFIDLSMGGGTQVLGHAHPAVQAAITAQTARGWTQIVPNQDQLAFAQLIQAAGAANERVVLCNSGSDAALYAMRAARAFTGKEAIAAFSGSDHGTHDYGAIAMMHARPAATSNSRRSGVPHAVGDVMTILSYGRAAALTQIRRRSTELAAVIVEPVHCEMPDLGHAAWLHELAAVCRETGVLMILDESVTGFRLAYGGAQELLGVVPDLTTYGRTIGGGLPLGAVAGRADIMEMFVSTPAQDGVANDPVFLGNPLSVAAGIATLQYMLAHRSVLYPALNEAGRTLAEAFNRFTVGEELPVGMRMAGSIFRIGFGVDPASGLPTKPALNPHAETAFYTSVLNRGVLMHASRRGFLSAAHTPADLSHILTVFTDSLKDIRDDGLLAPPA